MFIHYRTKGIIFKKEARGEANELFSIYTQDHGRLEVLGKAIRKISSKLRVGADLCCLSEIEFIQGKTYKTLTDAVLLNKFKNIRTNLKKLSVAYKILEALNDLVKDQESDEKIWRLLNEILNKLNDQQGEKLEIIYYYFFWNFLSFLGYQPELYNCLICQKKLIPAISFFDSSKGGIICPVCFRKRKSKTNASLKISPEAIKIVRIILQKNWKVLSKLRITADYLKSLKSISKNYLFFLRNS